MYDIPDDNSLGCIHRTHPVRKFCVWLIEPDTKPAAWFGNVVLVLIIVNCSILAIQSPVAGPAVRCALPEPGEQYDKTRHNCKPETYEQDAGAEPGDAESVKLHEVGPRFEMQLYQVRLGTLDQTEAENEWTLRPFMSTAKKRKVL